MRVDIIVNKTKKKLAELLNDESFIRWLKNEANIAEQDKWDLWQSENSNSQELIKKAKKLLTMPFDQPDRVPDKTEEMKKLKENLSKKTGAEPIRFLG